MSGHRLIESQPSEFRVEKARSDATLFLTNGTSSRGNFFVSGGAPSHAGPERIKDVLNAGPGFFPFEVLGAGGATQTILYNREHIVFVELAGNHEPALDPGYDVAMRRDVAMLLSSGTRLHGVVSIYRPHGCDRLSDFARSPEPFLYLETRNATYLVNVNHLIELVEEIS
jgi:hypothetical protein